nr:MAG TPA: hypothetical protein [Caudoviricetes sp.]
MRRPVIPLNILRSFCCPRLSLFYVCIISRKRKVVNSF